MEQKNNTAPKREPTKPGEIMQPIFVVQETTHGTARVIGAALTQDNAEILADKFADAVVNTGAIPKVTPTRYDGPASTDPREIRRYQFRRGSQYLPVEVVILEMEAETNPDY